MIKTLLIFLCLQTSILAADSVVISQSVVKFAQSNFGKLVGDEQCWTLAQEALKYANARLAGERGYQLYEFGRIVPVSQARPGDIIQFEQCSFGKWMSYYKYDELTNRFTRQPPVFRIYQTIYHHTSIVVKVQKISSTQTTIFTLDQRYHRPVARNWVDLQDYMPTPNLAGSRMTFYRPQTK